MKWLRLADELLDPLVRFLAPLEAGCVGFTEHLLQGGRVSSPPRKTHHVIVRVENTGTVTGAILQTPQGVYLPVLDPARPVVEAAAVTRLHRWNRTLYSIMGRARDVTALEDAFRRAPALLMEYHLMSQSDPPPELPLPRLPDGMTIRQAGTEEARHLFDIQKKYEIEEVLLPGNTFRATATMHHLRRTLLEQIVLVAEIEGTPIGKANTNARGIFFDQIGGVFTERALRSRGVGTALMLRLLVRIADARKNGCLFVKMDNAPALRMYQNLGMAVEDDFRISYYR